MLEVIHSFLLNLTTKANDPHEDRILASSVDLRIEVTLGDYFLRFSGAETLKGDKIDLLKCSNCVSVLFCNLMQTIILCFRTSRFSPCWVKALSHACTEQNL